MAVTITQRTSCAGCDVSLKPANQRKAERLFKGLKGKVGCVTDKSVDLIFPDQQSADRFEAEVTALGGIFD